MYFRIAGRQLRYLSLKYLSPAANSPEIRIVGRQLKYLSLKYLSPAANSPEIRIAGCQPKFLSLSTQAQLPIAWKSGLLVVSLSF